MKLIYTHDGMIGLNLGDGKPVIWVKSVAEAVEVAFTHFLKLVDPPLKAEIKKDIDYAIAHMIRTGDSIAEFGIFGSFMYTTTEPDYEF